MSFSSFMLFYIASILLLSVIYAYDEPIRRWEDRQIEKFKTFIVDISEKNN